MKSYDDLKTKYLRLIPPRFGFECELGWLGILDRYFTVVDRELPQDTVYELRQVKEKLGSLRIYDHSAVISAIIPIREAHDLTEARLFDTCEYCGKRGVWSNRGGYLTTVCGDHAVLDDRRAEPVESNDCAYRDGDGIWHLYDPDVDEFVESEAPDWAR